MRTVEDLQHAARRTGGRIEQTGRTSRGELTARLWFKDGWSTARFLERLAKQDAGDPRVRDLALAFRRRARSDRELAGRLHAFVRDRVQFVREPVETFQSTLYTLRVRAGDCDDSARALYALATAAGLRSRLAFLSARGEPLHVFAEIFHDGAWHAAETTIAAAYGEAPAVAAKRLGIRLRPDLASSKPVHLAGLGGFDLTGHDVTTATTYTAQPNATIRLVLEIPAWVGNDQIASDIKSLGFDPVEVVDDVNTLTPDWLADWRTMRTDAAHRIVWAQAVYSLLQAATLARDNPDFTVRGARQMDTITPPVNDTTPPDATPIPPEPGKDEIRTPWARAVLANAWRVVYPDRELTEPMAAGLLTVAWVETHLGAAGVEWNFGNVHCNAMPDKNTHQCPQDPKAYGKYANGCTPFTDVVPSCFRTYPDAVAGMADFVAIVTRGAAFDAFNTGDPATIAKAMAANGYYGINPPQSAITNYTAALAGALPIVQKRLRESGWIAACGFVAGLVGAAVAAASFLRA